MARRPTWSGASKHTLRSRRPGRISAGSKTSLLLVAATSKISVRSSKPSSSTRSCMRVFSRSCSAPLAESSLLRPKASTSSMNRMQGCSFLAISNNFFTSVMPAPAKREAWKSLPEADRKGSPTSPAKARAQCVFPTPGGPSSSTPRGGFAPTFSYRSRFCIASTTSRSSSTASSCPRTSANVTSTMSVTWNWPSGRTFDLDFLASCRLSSTSFAVIAPRSARTAAVAALFKRVCRSAGEKAGVCFATSSRFGPSSSSANRNRSAAFWRISCLPSRFGSLNSTRLSKRPLRRRAASSTSGRFVAARKSTPECGSKPSIFASRAFRFASWSLVTDPPSSPASRIAVDVVRRASAKESISSMKMMHGLKLRACSNIFNVIDVPTPEKGDCRKSEPEIAKKGTPAAEATARAAKVFPVPGSPQKRTPFGGTAPTFSYFPGLPRRSTSSCSFSFTSGEPRKESIGTYAASPGSIFLKSRTLLYARCKSSVSSFSLSPDVLPTAPMGFTLGKTPGTTTPIVAGSRFRADWLSQDMLSRCSSTPKFTMPSPSLVIASTVPLRPLGRILPLLSLRTASATSTFVPAFRRG
mmetsp:Transcript_10429/g.23640  ORF Transcript_10429/g.23640 Transcript_10429/m.23640 type:complete len:583 (-) Transcript_10429:856-2604(-)